MTSAAWLLWNQTFQLDREFLRLWRLPRLTVRSHRR